MTAKKPGSIRSAAIDEVQAGGAIEDVALKFGIAPAKLMSWAATAKPFAAASEIRPTQPTIIDVAERANVSKSVVSRALRGQYGVSEDARARVQAAAEELGFVLNAAAQRLSAKRTNTLGVLVRDASSPFYGEMQSALQIAGRQHGQRVFITSGALDRDDEVQALEDLIALRVDGLIVCSGRLDTDKIARFAAKFPVVVAGRVEQDPRLSSVYGDEDAGSAALAQHLAELGHREVAVLQPSATESPALHRRSGIMADSLLALGLGAHVIPVIDSTSAAAITVPGRVSAIMCPNDRYAAALLAAASPSLSDRAVTGFDGVGGLASELIGLTTWVQPIQSMGAAAVDVLMNSITGDNLLAHRAIPGRLRPSRSTLDPQKRPT